MLGSLIDLNDLKREWKTVIFSVVGVVGVVIIGLTLGQLLFGREYALSALGPVSGGMTATMILTEAANNAGRPDLAAFVAAVMAFQMLIGLPVAAWCLRKESFRFLAAGEHLRPPESKSRPIRIRLLPPTPSALDTPTIHLARLAIVGVLVTLVTNATGISTGITFLVGGMIFGAIGFVEKGSLRTAGGEGLLMFATYASVAASFLSISLAQFGTMLLPVFGILILSAVGIILLCGLSARLLRWSPYLAIAVGLSCMFGYPATQAVAMEVSAGVLKGKGYSPEEEQRLYDHLTTKMIIAGTVSVSISSVVLASTVAPVLFG